MWIGKRVTAGDYLFLASPFLCLTGAVFWPVASISLFLSPDPRVLVEHAAQGFLTPSRAAAGTLFPTPDYLLTVRQGGIRDTLIRLAAQRGVPGWFDPPLCVFHELPHWLGETDRKPCGDFERVVLLEGLLRRVGTDLFARTCRLSDFVEAVDQHFGELVAEGITPDVYRSALAAGGPEDFERRRNGDLGRAYALYWEELARENRRDGRDQRYDCALTVERDPDRLATRLGGRREIRIFGLADPRGGWRALLRALVKSTALDRVVIYASEPLDLGPGLECTVERLDGEPSLAGRLFEPSETSAGSVDLIDAPDAEREVDEVVRRVRALADRGVRLDRIAIVARQARPYLEHVLRTLERVGVPVAARRRVAYAEIPVVRATLALFAAAAEGWSRHGLAELAEQPYFSNRLDPRIIAFLGFRTRLLGLEQWEQALRGLVEETDPAKAKEEEEDEHRKPLPSHGRAQRALQTFLEFAGHARELDRARPLLEWLTWLERFLDQDPWRIAHRVYDLKPERPADLERVRIARLDLAGWNGMKAIVVEWRQAVERWGDGAEELSVEQFDTRLQAMLAGDAAFWTETPRGVQVLEGLAAAYRTFDYLFLVGLSSDRFPKRAPSSALFTEEERRQLAAAGLPLDLREVWDRRERALFRVLVAGAGEKLTVSAPRMDEAGGGTVPSVFLEELGRVAEAVTETIPTPRVLTPSLPVIRDWGQVERARVVAEIERVRKTRVLSPYNGLIEDPELLAWVAQHRGDDYQWSPTQLEGYAKCPWAYFSGRLLRLEKLEDPDDDLDPATRGAILHEALERFFKQAGERVKGAVFLRQEHLAWAEPMLLAALEESVRAREGVVWLGHPALRVVKKAEMGRLLIEFLHWEVEQHEDMYDPKKRNAPAMVRTAVAEHEVAIQDVRLNRGGVLVRFRGRIDRVEVGIDERVNASKLLAAVDYKSSEFSTPGGGKKQAWEDNVVLQVPLYAYALSQLRPDYEACRVEYRALKQCKAVHALELYQVDKKTRRLESDSEAKAKLEHALDAAAEHVKAVRRGEFPARPAPSCNCPPWCHGWDICRVPGGPKGNLW